MVVDDIEWVRTMLVELLNEVDGVEVCTTASDGDEAVALALELRPDLVLMDLRMPRMDGVVATRHMLEAWPEAKVIINSAYGDEALIDSAIDAGAVGYVTKDRRPSELIEAIVEHCRAGTT